MGTVIKAGTTGKALKGFERYSLTDHMAEARAVVLAAKHRAEMTVRRAEEKAVELQAEARQTGYDVGFREGRVAGEKAGCDDAREQAGACFATQQEGLLSTLSSMAARIERSKRDLLERAQHDLLAFGVTVAGHITKRAGAVDDQIAVQNAAEAIRHVGDWTDLVIRVHPRDGRALVTYAAGLACELAEHRHVRVTEDDAIDPGGCVVESPHTRVDATLAAQFKEVVTLLLGDDDESVDGMFALHATTDAATDVHHSPSDRDARHLNRTDDGADVESSSDAPRQGGDE